MDEKEAEIYSIKWWFEKEYTVHEQKYRRLISLNKPDAAVHLAYSVVALVLSQFFALVPSALIY